MDALQGWIPTHGFHNRGNGWGQWAIYSIEETLCFIRVLDPHINLRTVTYS